jgi:hypothetical protein
MKKRTNFSYFGKKSHFETKNNAICLAYRNRRLKSCAKNALFRESCSYLPTTDASVCVKMKIKKLSLAQA